MCYVLVVTETSKVVHCKNFSEKVTWIVAQPKQVELCQEHQEYLKGFYQTIIALE